MVSWRQQWDDFHDAQRMERLQACSQLDQILRDCRSGRRRQDPQKQQQQQEQQPQPYGDHTIEGTSAGLRVMKYFGWRGILGPTPTDPRSDGRKDDEGTADEGTAALLPPTLRTQIRQSCAREQHAVWACRAVATGCGKDLGALKRCFDGGGGNSSSIGPSNLPNNNAAATSVYSVLTEHRTSYDGKSKSSSNSGDDSNDDDVPCRDMQELLGRCVTASARQLLERQQQREARK